MKPKSATDVTFSADRNTRLDRLAAQVVMAMSRREGSRGDRSDEWIKREVERLASQGITVARAAPASRGSAVELKSQRQPAHYDPDYDDGHDVTHPSLVTNGEAQREILEVIQELADLVFYNCHQFHVEMGGRKKIVGLKVWEDAVKSAADMKRRYGRKNLGPWTDFEWGMMNGKLAALRWVLGEPWDPLHD
jgi:hypothetical protein